MARIQILELPMQEGDDGKVVTPFALIIDQYDESIGEHTAKYFAEFRERCGARAMVIFPGVVDIPSLSAEEVATINQSHIGTATVDVVPDLTRFETAITDAIERAQNALIHALGTGHAGSVGVYVGDKKVDTDMGVRATDLPGAVEDAIRGSA